MWHNPSMSFRRSGFARVLPVLVLWLGLLASPASPAYRGGSDDTVSASRCRTRQDWRDVRDWWPAGDFAVRFRVPRGSRVRWRFDNAGAARTFRAAGRCVRQKGDWTVIDLTAGLRARARGGYWRPDAHAWADDLNLEIVK